MKPLTSDRRARTAHASPFFKPIWILIVLAACSAGALQLYRVYPSLEMRLPGYYWRPGAAGLSYMAARSAAEAGDSAAASEEARKAIAAEPLNIPAIVLLASEFIKAGDEAQASSILDVVSLWTRRNSVADYMKIAKAHAAGDSAEVVRLYDIMLRVRIGGTPETLFTQLSALVDDPAALAAMVSRMSVADEWRDPFLRYLAQKAPETQFPIVARAFAARTGTVPLTAWSFYLQRLMDAGEVHLAHDFWLRLPPVDQKQAGKLLFNGNFTTESDQLPFNWVYKSDDRTMIARRALNGNPALVVEFAGTRSKFIGVRQYLMLAPGRYQFTGKMKLDNLQTPRGLQWSITCRDGGKDRPIAQTDIFAGNTGLRDLSLDFVIPDAGCDIQSIVLKLAARAVVETQASGRAWFDDLDIEAQTE